jgi:hypothetical protein
MKVRIAAGASASLLPTRKIDAEPKAKRSREAGAGSYGERRGASPFLHGRAWPATHAFRQAPQRLSEKCVDGHAERGHDATGRQMDSLALALLKEHSARNATAQMQSGGGLRPPSPLCGVRRTYQARLPKRLVPARRALVGVSQKRKPRRNVPGVTA